MCLRRETGLKSKGNLRQLSCRFVIKNPNMSLISGLKMGPHHVCLTAWTFTPGSSERLRWAWVRECVCVHDGVCLRCD